MPLRDGFLAIDIGTQSSRAAILTAEGETLALVSRPHSMATPRPGWAEQNPEHWWEATVDNVRDVLSQSDGRVGIAAVAVCGQMHGTVPVARDGTALTPAVQLWCDKRAAGIAEEISAAHDPAALMGMAGNIPTAAWSGFKMAWMRRYQPEIYDQAWAILTPKDFVNLRLTGEIGTDRTEASGSFLMDVQSAEWSSTLIALLGLEAEKLPAIHASSDIIAGVSVEASRQTGLPSGTPVVAGSGDMLALLLGTGITAPGIACDISGTASIVSFHAGAPVTDSRLMNLHATGPHWIAFGILDSGGGSLRWWRDQFMSDGAGGGDAIYDQMMSEAAAVPAGCEGLLFLPYLLGERTLGSAASRGVFFGFHPRHGRAHATRAILEGICFDLRQSLEIAREAGIPVNEMRTGGGGARSEFWSGIKADVYALPVAAIEHEEAGILGAAMLAMVGAGVFPSESAAAAHLVRPREGIEPDVEAIAVYDRHYRLFRTLHDRLQSVYREAAVMLSA
jgi:xylulokinase